MTQTSSSNFSNFIWNANFNCLWTCDPLDNDDDDDNDDNDDDNDGGDDDDDIERQQLWRPLWP